jgi:N-acetylneuraminate epimerase
MIGRSSRWLRFLVVVGAMTGGNSGSAADRLIWSKLAPIPDAEGFAAPFAGVHHGALLVAGGANFPDNKPWEGGTKVWYDSVFVLDRPDGMWRRAGKLPRPLAYGMGVSTENGVVCIGGADVRQHFADCFLLTWRDGKLGHAPLPSLPKPCAYFSGVSVGDTVYVVGGIDTPTATTALKTFWSLDLSKPDAGWRELEPCPGHGRMLAAIGAHGESVYVFGGTALKADAAGMPERVWLRDAHRFTPGQGWKQLAELPRVVIAAPFPSPTAGDSKLLIVGGDDGAQVALPPTEHKGFPRDVLAYDVEGNAWSRFGEVPFSLVTTSIVRWHGRLIIPGGEKRPGYRSTEVWSGEFVRE